MRNLKETAGITLAVGLLAGMAGATPSTTYWTPATTDIQSYRVLHVGIDNYFTVQRKQDHNAGQFPTDLQMELGILPFDKVQAEVGVDYLQPQDDPFLFNAKIGSPENAWFKGSPAVNAGIFDVGAKRGVTDYDILDVLIGKTIPVFGRLFIGGYHGNGGTLLNSQGDTDNIGIMIAMDHGFWPVKDKSGDEYNRMVFAADWASGKNYIGGGGAGLYYYFTKNISLLTGPVFFNDKGINGEWKWTTQLDINVPF
ncbi:MAG: hypothetical protein WC381_00570 [Kiritimatiellia bacterium]|jgi:hypothetical protein